MKHKPENDTEQEVMNAEADRYAALMEHAVSDIAAHGGSIHHFGRAAAHGAVQLLLQIGDAAAVSELMGNIIGQEAQRLRKAKH